MTGKERSKKELPSAPTFGEVPPPSQFHPARKVFRYAELLHKVREHPNSWAMIAVFDEGPPSNTARRVAVVCNEVLSYLRRYFPLEVWDVSRRTIPDTWNRRELWVRYTGDLTPEQAAEARQARREMWQRGRGEGKAAARRAAKEAAARIRALAVNKEIADIAAEQRRRDRER